MKKYKEIILNRLLDKYEKSKSFAGINVVNQSFAIQLEKEFEEFVDDANIAEIQAINNAASELAEAGFVALKLKKNGLLSSVMLNMNELESIYKFLKRKPKSYINDELSRLLYKYCGKNDILKAYCTNQLKRLENNKNVDHFGGNLTTFENVLKAVSALTEVDRETYQRDFSVRLYGDSKQFEKLRSTVVSILFEYGDFPEKETVLEDLNVVRNPGHVYFKGCGRVTIDGQCLDFSKLPGDIAISSSLLNDIDWILVEGDSVVTIENLTTFNSYKPDGELVIYLGGFHNTVRREFIKKLYADNPDVNYYHYGDIDAGGFNILLHLRRMTGVDFKPFNMDVATLKKYFDFTRKLTDNDRKRLKKLLDSEFNEVISFMLDNDCKLEQEAVEY